MQILTLTRVVEPSEYRRASASWAGVSKIIAQDLVTQGTPGKPTIRLETVCLSSQLYMIAQRIQRLDQGIGTGDYTVMTAVRRLPC